jgi:acyl-CoA synthetase (AMP-forming)/AMP-acid ligase II
VFLWEILDNAAAATGQRTALVADGHRWTFSELADEVSELARRVATLARPGERVALVSDNSASYVCALYGVPRAGAVLVHGNTRHTTDELGAMLERSGATLLLASKDQLERLEAVQVGSLTNRVLLDDLIGDRSASAVQPETTEPPEPGEPQPGTDSGGRIGDSALAWLMYTSGTTGAPKGVMLTHRSLIAAALNTTMARPVADDEVYLFPFPLFHVAAYNVVHHHLRRRPVVLLPSFEPVAAMETIAAERVTSVSLAPTMLAVLLDHPERHRFDLSSLRNVSYGAAAMPLDLLRRSLHQWPGVGLSQGYGMTELSGNAVFLSPEDHRRAATDDPALLTAAGRPAPMTSLRIVDDHDAEVTSGDEGEILVRGDQVCAGYFEDAASTAESITDGWLHTGDVGRIDERGYLHVVDRVKDIVITGGENVSSREVEDAVGTHPAVRSVAVVGTPDQHWGELVTAVVVPTDPDSPPAVDDLRVVCSHLAGFKHPRRVIAVELLPTNASGKVDKVALRSAVAATDTA